MKLISAFSYVIAAILLLVSCSKKVDDELINKKPSSFSLVEVLNQATDVNLLPRLQWNSSTDLNGDDITYTILLDVNEDPVKEIAVGLEENSYILSDPLLYETTYYWKVLAIDDTGLSTTSNEVFSFTTKKENSIGSFNLISVANEAIDITLLPTFVWEELVTSDGGTVQYELLMDTNETPVTSIAENIEETNYIIETPLAEDTTYYWKVIAKDSSGLIIESDEVFSFTTLKDNNQPKPFTLIGVTNTAEGVDLNPQFSWNASQDDDGDELIYTLYLDQNEDPQTIFADGITELSYNVEDDKRLGLLNTYFWKVEVKDGKGGVAVSSTYSFTTRGFRNPIKVTDNAPFGERYAHTLTVFKDQLWLIGGYKDGLGTGCYDIWTSNDGENWNLKEANAPFGARGYHITLVFDNKLWVIGGADDGYNSFYNDVWFTSDGENWANYDSVLPFDVKSLSSRGVVYNNSIWICDFEDTGARRIATSTDGATWATDVITDVPNEFPEARFGITEFNNALWISGGSALNSSITKSNNIYTSIDGKSWSLVTANASFPERTYQIMFTLDNKMWLIGGSNGSTIGNVYNDIWYTEDGENWIEYEEYDMNMFYGGISHATIVFKDKIWITGGYDGGALSEIWYIE
ncbi:hypothetical protein GCM10022393_29090 [Aquimarina addita]|uniref:Fibronectin type-III domain-containing protein n=1 Tax=Aquimarina addita TaxID=870485 RepID=A0ABP6UQK5_9FLAO